MFVVATAVAMAQEPGAPAALPEASVSGGVKLLLETHCARCHQASPDTQPALVGNFTNALAIDEIARDLRLVIPGVPDASLLYVTMLNRHRPTDIFRDGSRWGGPSTTEIAAVRTWIGGLDTAAAAQHALQPAKSVLAVRTQASRYKAGDEFDLGVQSATDCHLTLIGVDPTGQAVVLFPNDLEPDNKLAAGAMRRIPADDAGYRLRTDTRGREILIAICRATAQPPLRIVHDYEHERFTILGDWEQYLAKVLDEEAAGKAPRQKVERRRPRRRGPEPTPEAPPSGFEREVRETLVIDVE